MFAAARRPATRLPAKQAFYRLNSTQPPPPPTRGSWLHRTKTAAKYGGYFCLSTVVGLATVGIGILVHDVFTYNDKHVDRVPVSPLALHPERGGPKNLPIARVQVDDEEDEEARKLLTRPKLVIVGGGWGVCLSSIMSPHTQLTTIPTGYGRFELSFSRGLSCYNCFPRHIHYIHPSPAM